MEGMAWIVFLSSVFVGSYVQAVTGFAMGMIVIAVAGASGAISGVIAGRRTPSSA